jgi:hypothetical protein
MSNLIGMSRQHWRQHRPFATVAGIAAALSIGAAASALALGGRTTRQPKVTFSVLKHHGVRATTETSGPIPAGATLAAATNSNGIATEILVAELPNGEVCLTDLQVGKGSATACGRPAEVQQNGVEVGLGGPNTHPSMAVLVPDGVTSATVTYTSGSSYAQEVTNNIIAVTDPNVTSVSYTAPSGATKTFRVLPNVASAQPAP